MTQLTVKKQTGAALRMKRKRLENDVPYKLLLIIRQKTKLHDDFLQSISYRYKTK